MASAATILTLTSISAIPEQNIYKDMLLDNDLRQATEQKSWNYVSYATNGNVTKSKSWLFGDKTVSIEPTTRVVSFSTRWDNFYDNGLWKEINTDIATSTSGEIFEMRKAPFEVEIPLRSGGIAKMINKNTWDIQTDSAKSITPASMSITAQGVMDVAGRIEHGNLHEQHGIISDVDYVVYPNAYENGDLIYYVHKGIVPSLEKLIRFYKKPLQLSYSFKLDFDRNAELYENIRNNDSFHITNNDGFELRKFYIWDSKISRVNPRTIQELTLQIDTLSSSSYRITKNLPSDFFNTAIYPVLTDTIISVSPDANPETNSVDGDLRCDTNAGCGTTWATAQSAADSSTAGPSGTLNIGESRDLSGTRWIIERGVMLFDTSSIGSGQTVSSSTLVVFGDDKSDGDNDGNDYCVVVSSSPASNTDLVVGDYDQVGTTAFSDTIDLTAGWPASPSTAWITFTLNATGYATIDTTGISKFAIREGHDINNDAPAGTTDTYCEWHQADNTSPPRLKVEYAASVAGTTKKKPLWDEISLK